MEVVGWMRGYPRRNMAVRGEWLLAEQRCVVEWHADASDWLRYLAESIVSFAFRSTTK